MITFYRRVMALPGKTPAALTFTKEIAAHIGTLTGHEVRVGVPVGGNPSRIGWSVAYENLAAMDEAQMQMTSDAAYWEMVAQTATLFVPGSAHDDIWRTL